MCHFLLRWYVVIREVGIHALVRWTEVAVDGCGDTSAAVDFSGVVEECLWCNGAWGGLGRSDRLPKLRRFGRLGAVHLHVEISGLFDADGGIQGKLL